MGFSVSELSNLLMCEFHYQKLQPYYNHTQSASGKIKLHYIDTDSFILSIKTKDPLKDLEYFKK